MPINPRRLKPGEACRLLNSTPLGTVISERQLYRYRQRGGFRVGDGTHVDLLRLTAWLAERRHQPRPSPQDRYEQQRERMHAREQLQSQAGRNIGDLPAVVDVNRKLRAREDFQFFCESYFPLTYHLPWSPDHLKVIAKTEQSVRQGGLFALAMARGSGKTSIAETAGIWAMLYGHREFVCLIGSDEAHAMEMLDSIKTELDGNDLLLADFPEAVFPIHALEGIANRCAGQLYHDVRTHISWTAKEIVLPTIQPAGWADDEHLRAFIRPDGHALASGAIIKVAGLTGRIRGMKFKRPDGRSVRPSLVVIDDPQSDESARSLSQCAARESILAGAVLGLAGPGKKISGIMPCTVIRPGDMADNILNRDKHPEWNGQRTKLIYAFPQADRLWARYAEIRAESLRQGNGLQAATEFYGRHRAEMDEGAVVAWPERFNHDELSAVQHAMNLKLQDETAFFAEYQNDPLPPVQPLAEDLTADDIAAKVNGRPPGEVPLGCDRVTMFVDVQQKLLYYVVVAWTADFGGFVVDYGTWPNQHREYFTLRDAQTTIATQFPTMGLEGSLYAAMQALLEEQLGREWAREDGAALTIERCLIDANWGNSTEVVYQFCRESTHAAVLSPSHGRYVGAASTPFSDYRRRPGDRVGHHWRMPNVQGRRAVRYVLFDSNYWKSFVYARLATPTADRGCLSLFGRQPQAHRLFAEHLTAECRVRTEGRGRQVDEWRLRPERNDNHWLDGLVGCAVGASIQGVELLASAEHRTPSSRRIKLSGLPKKRTPVDR